jgi:mRNA interferase HigB
MICSNDKPMLKAFEDFRRRMKYAEGSKTPQGLVNAFQNSDLITCKKSKQSRIVFNIGNNKYRLICGYLFKTNTSILFIKFVGTHIEYDKIDACQVNMFK